MSSEDGEGIYEGAYFDLEEMRAILNDKRGYTVPNGLKTLEDFCEWLDNLGEEDLEED